MQTLRRGQVAYKNIEFMVWDMGGQDAIRQLWQHYYKNAQALIFVVDSADEERLAEARDELQVCVCLIA